jgi:hypothetical protein
LAAGFGAKGFGTGGLQEDLAHEDEWNLAQEEYFRDILRGYSPTARRTLRELRIAGDECMSLTRNGCNTFGMVLWKLHIPVGVVSDQN